MTLMTAMLMALQSGAPAGPMELGPPVYVSLMGEMMRPEGARSPVAAWIARADKTGDHRVSASELVGDAERFFRILDIDGNGSIDPTEMERYERELAPRDLRLRAAGRRPGPPIGARAEGMRGRPEGPLPGSPGGRGSRAGSPRAAESGPARDGLPSLPELPQPVAAADLDMNRLVTITEFRTAAGERFATADRNGDGQLEQSELMAAAKSPRAARRLVL